MKACWGYSMAQGVKISLSEEKGFGLDASNVTVEKFPLVVAPVKSLKLKRIIQDEE